MAVLHLPVHLSIQHTTPTKQHYAPTLLALNSINISAPSRWQPSTARFSQFTTGSFEKRSTFQSNLTLHKVPNGQFNKNNMTDTADHPPNKLLLPSWAQSSNLNLDRPASGERARSTSCVYAASNSNNNKIPVNDKTNNLAAELSIPTHNSGGWGLQGIGELELHLNQFPVLAPGVPDKPIDWTTPIVLGPAPKPDSNAHLSVKGMFARTENQLAFNSKAPVLTVHKLAQVKPVPMGQESDVSSTSSSHVHVSTHCLNGKERNDHNKRSHKESMSHRSSAGGNSRKNMGKSNAPTSEVFDNESEGSDSKAHTVNDNPDGPYHIHHIIDAKDGRLRVIRASEDLHFVEWGSFIKVEETWNQVAARHVHRVATLTGTSGVSETTVAKVMFGAGVAATSLVAGYAAYKSQPNAPAPQRWFNALAATVTCAATTWYMGQDVIQAPLLAGAGSDLSCLSESVTFSPIYNHQKYTSRRSGPVYISILVALKFEFTGCTPDSHLCARMLKRGVELGGKFYSHDTLDMGILSDTVSYAASVIQATLTRAVSSTVVTGSMPVTQWA